LEIHQATEKLLKAVIAFNGIKMPKTHNLIELKIQTEKFVSLEITNIDSLIEINDYYETERYPGPKYSIPSKDEIEKNITFTENLFEKVDAYINSNTDSNI
jgi:HEPN domain-containing protein